MASDERADEAATGEAAAVRVTIDAPVVPVEDAGIERWQRRSELIALVLVLCSIGTILQALFQGIAVARGAGPDGELDWDVLLPVVASSGTFVNGLLLTVALALVVLAPGSRVGRLGGVVLNVVAVVGVLVATLAVLGLEETIRGSDAVGPTGEGDGTTELLTTLSGASLWLPSIALAGLVAYLAWRLVLELYADSVHRVGDEDPDAA